MRCCISCGHTYRGPLACPRCGEPGEPIAPLRNHRPDGTNNPETTIVSARLNPAELAALDARRMPGERRSDAVRRLLKEKGT